MSDGQTLSLNAEFEQALQKYAEFCGDSTQTVETKQTQPTDKPQEKTDNSNEDENKKEQQQQQQPVAKRGRLCLKEVFAQIS